MRNTDICQLAALRVFMHDYHRITSDRLHDYLFLPQRMPTFNPPVVA